MKIMEIKIIRTKNLADGLNGRLKTFETKNKWIGKEVISKTINKGCNQKVLHTYKLNLRKMREKRTESIFKI